MEDVQFPWQEFFNDWLNVRGFTAREAAPLLGISISCAYEYRAGNTYPKLSRVSQLASAMGVTEQRVLDVLTREVRARRLVEAKRSA